MEKEDLRLLIGDKGKEFELPAYMESPTWIVDGVWEKVKDIAMKALLAYMEYCKTHNLPHSYLLGLDILITASTDGMGKYLVDLRPTILEGPCCNSYPACPNFWAYRLYKKSILEGLDPDSVEYPLHPTKILDRMAKLFVDVWQVKGNKTLPRLAIFTRPYEYSEEESAHNTTLEWMKKCGLEIYRITPDEKPEVKNGKLCLAGIPIDVAYRRIERIHVPQFYGEDLAKKIIYETPETIWINPWKIDDLRSKTIEERCFREWEQKTGDKISRPITLLGKEINAEAVRKIADTGGFAFKKWNSTGGKGVLLYLNKKAVGNIPDLLYERYDGRHMIILDEKQLMDELAKFDNFSEDASIQQLRLIDARSLKDGKLVYDTRINVIYDPVNKKWDILSGISRVVKCGQNVQNGNTLLTNISSGAEIAPLVIGYTKRPPQSSKISFGPILRAIMEGQDKIAL